MATDVIDELRNRLAQNGEVPQPKAVRMAPEEAARSQYPEPTEGEDGDGDGGDK